MGGMAREEMKAILAGRAAQIDEFFRSYPLESPGIPARLKDAMLYSLKAGGKRIRPALCMAWAALCGREASRVVPFAAAIEMIHTYSLIHDDLPAMDDDDLRRGRPSNHKAFGEATAILAGDGLLTDSFTVICGMDLAPAAVLRALAELSRAAGSGGMVGGQALDMAYTGLKEITLEQLVAMQRLKTGAMLRASCVCGALLANGGPAELEKAADYGEALGDAFQIADDILDVTGDTKTLGKPAGSDAKSGKITWPSLVGLKKSKAAALERAEDAKHALEGFSGPEAAFLVALADYTVERTL